MADIYETFDKTLYRLNTAVYQTDALSDITAVPAVSVPDISAGIDPAQATSGPTTTTQELVQGALQSGNFLTGVRGWIIKANGDVEFGSGKFRGDITGATGTFSGTVTVASLNIPDSTTANSMHVDSSGNTWWGANVAGGYTSANAYVLATGVTSFKNVLIGGTSTQYQIGNGGMFTFGDGSDGAGVADGTTALAGATLAASVYTLTRDVYYTDLTVSTGVTIKPSGYRIFGIGTLTLNGTAIISRNGNAGSDGVNDNGLPNAGGLGGVALANGYLKGSIAGGNGGASVGSPNPAGAGVAGGNTTNSLGTNGVYGGSGRTGTNAAGAAGAGGTATASNVKLIANWHLATLLDIGSTGSTVKFDNSAASGGGGAGANSSFGNGGSGGGGGSAGGIIAIYFRSIIIGASASITTNGGNGGKGGNTALSGCGGGGAGGGGNGGQIILVYNLITNSGTLSASGGVVGVQSTGGGAPSGSGENGTAGTVRQFLISM